jgi:hypothetical protein
MAGKLGHASGNADGAMDAINAALGLEGDEAHEAPADEEINEGAAEEGDTSADSTDEGATDDATEGAEGGDGEGAESEEDIAAAAAAAGGERNPDGTFKKAGEVKKADPLNDPIPKDLKKETSERIRSLIETTKTVTAERDQIRSDFDTIVNGIKASGSTPEQYGEVISWMSLFNSPDPQSRMKAYELVNDVADRLATLLNIDRQAPNPIAKHPDLAQAVQAGQITAKYAAEIARTRESNAFKSQLTTQQQSQLTQQQQQQQEEAQARSGLTAFENEMRASDPLYEQKKAAILPALRAVMSKIPKSQWVETYKAAYANAKVKPQGTVAKKPTNQPLRANKNPAGGQGRAASSMMDAINGALSSMK